MNLTQRLFHPDDQGGGGQPEGPKPTFDRTALPPFLQKYPGNSMEEVLKAADTGYWNMVNHTRDVLDKAKPAIEKASAYDRMMASVGGEKTQPQSSIAQLAAELGVSPELVARSQAEIAAAVFTQALAPVLGEYTATQELATEIGEEFTALKPKVTAWLKENPNAQADFDSMKNTHPKAAWELAMRRFAATQQDNPAGGSKAQASLMGGRASAGRPAPAGPDRAKLDAAADYHRKFSDPGPMLHEASKGTSIEAAVKQMHEYMTGLNL